MQPRHNFRKRGVTRVPQLEAVVLPGEVVTKSSRTTITKNTDDYFFADLKNRIIPEASEFYNNFGGRMLVTVANQYYPFYIVHNPACQNLSQECKPKGGMDYNMLSQIGQALNFR
jgi:hypothetical protein